MDMTATFLIGFIGSINSDHRRYLDLLSFEITFMMVDRELTIERKML